MSVMELEINGEVFKFRFGMAFLRDIEKRYKQTVQLGITQDVGLSFTVADMMDGSSVAISVILDLANKTENPRISQKKLDAYLEDENTDLEELKEMIIDFLSKSNVCRAKMNQFNKTLQDQENEEQ